MATEKTTGDGPNAQEAGKATTGTGNASNPPAEQSAQPPVDKQYLNKKAEKYLRESGNIEDMPDAQEQQEADELIAKNRKEQ
jgi:hypothetical protein